ncbi:MAG: sigma-70 family RNA polymerase sigma factor [Prevotellaceae bacterium]|jgi:RNA polymerase sigma-70 factor (ECF subfamily)|nr:sigma-70 family RNA polymerase sigma factor [Prevotellaceae bacterium]
MELMQFKIHVLPLRKKLADYAFRLMQNSEDAEDVVQETMLRLWDRRSELDDCRNIEAFAVTMAHNLCMDGWRRKRPTTTIDLLNGSDNRQATPEQELQTKDEMTLIRHIIDSLPPLQQVILRMKDVEGYETEYIAEITGCRPEAIRMNLARARKRVRECYLTMIQRRKIQEV